MEETLWKIDMAEAALDSADGLLPDAQRRLDRLVEEMSAPKSASERDRLCRTLQDRAYVNGQASRWRDQLRDLDWCEEEAEKLPATLRRFILQTVYERRVLLLSNREPAIFDPVRAWDDLVKIRGLGVDPQQADWLECRLMEGEGKWDRVAELAVQSTPWWEKRGWAEPAAASRLTACRAFFELKDYGRAEAELEPALDFFLRSGRKESFALACKLKAALQQARGDGEAAWESIGRAMEGVEDLLSRTGSLYNQQAFLQDKAGLYQDALAIALGSGGREGWLRAWGVAERAKSFFLRLILTNAEIPLFQGVNPEQLGRLRELDGRLDALEKRRAAPPAGSESEEPPGEVAGKIEALSDERRELFEVMTRDNPRWGSLRGPMAFDMADELSRLGADWGVLSYYWTPSEKGSTLHFFFMGRDREPRHHAVGWSREELKRFDAHAGRLRGFVLRDTVLLPDDLARKVLPPEVLAVFLAADEAGPEFCLLISPHDRLEGFPIHALFVDEECVLIERIPVLYIPSLGLLPFSRQGRGSASAAEFGPVLLLGCEQDGFRDGPLKEVPGEIEGLRTLWEAGAKREVVRCLLGSEERIGDAGVPLESWERFEFLHVASHGVFPEDRPLDASLRLGAEGLRMVRFFNQKLNAQVIVLSACAVGRHAKNHEEVAMTGGEWIGFHLPLFYAGARTVVASVWDANSPVAAGFMAALHEGLRAGRTPARAFRDAALKAAASEPIPFWANWCVAGFPD